MEMELKKNEAWLVKFPQDSIILKEGEVNPDMYKIVKGKVELYTGYGTDREVLLGIIGEQACFGEFGLLMQSPGIYTVVAYSEVYAIRVTPENMDDFVRENPKSVVNIMKNMSRMMTIMQQQIDLLTQEILSAGAHDSLSAGTHAGKDDVNDASDADEIKIIHRNELIQRSRRNLRSYAIYDPSSSLYGMTSNGYSLFGTGN